MNEFNEDVRDLFFAASDIVIKSMMGGYLVYLNGKLMPSLYILKRAAGRYHGH